MSIAPGSRRPTRGSDLAVLSIDGADVASANLVPIRLGDAATLRKGQIVVTLGNPYAIARDGQSSAGWGIVSNLGRKAPPLPDETDSSGKTTLHHYRRPDPDRCQAAPGHQRRTAVESPRRNDRAVRVARRPWRATSRRPAMPSPSMPRSAACWNRSAGPRGGIRLPRHPPRQPKPAEIAAGLQGIRGRMVPGTPAARAGLAKTTSLPPSTAGPSMTPTAWCWR